MSRPSQKRKKFARKPTPPYPVLETIREDEDLVATATQSTLQGSDVIGSKAFQKTSKRGRRRKAKRAPAQRVAASRTQASDALEAFWKEIDAPAKETLALLFGPLVTCVDRGRDDLRRELLAIIQSKVCPDDSALTVVVTDFMTILGEGSIDALREIEARADEMSNCTNKDMAGRDPDDMSTDDISDGDRSIESTSNKSTWSGTSDISMNSVKSNMSVEDEYPLSPNEGPNNEST